MERKVMIVDDSALSRRLMSRILGKIANLTIVEVADPLLTLENYLVEKPDLVLLDLNMDGITGMELLQLLHRYNPNQKIIIASADIQKATIEEARKFGACDYITKPFEESDILSKVELALKS